MQAMISKWGNSLALRLPRHVAEEARLTEGSTVELVVEEGSLRVTPTRKKFKLSELLEGEPPVQERSAAKEVDWGPAKGEETW